MSTNLDTVVDTRIKNSVTIITRSKIFESSLPKYPRYNYRAEELITMDCSHIQFCAQKEKIDLHQLLELYKLGAFWAKERKLEDLEIAIANSNPVVSVWDRERLIGFARATSDGIYRAAIWDVVVHPEYRGVGLGRKLVETVLTHPQVNKVERVYLTTTHQQSFYERIGFKRNDTTTMVLYNNYPLSSLSLSEQTTQIGIES